MRLADTRRRGAAVGPDPKFRIFFIVFCNLGDTLLGAVGVALRALTSARIALAPATVPATQTVECMPALKHPPSDVNEIERVLGV